MLYWLDCIIACPSRNLKSWGQLFCLLFVRGFCGDHICCCSVAQSCPTLCIPVDYSTRGFPVLHSLREFAQTRVHWISDAIQPSHPLSSPSLPALNLPASGAFLMSWLFTSHSQSTGALASASVLPVNVQGWFSLGLTGFDLLAVQGTLKSLLHHHSLKASILQCSAFFMIQLSGLDTWE